MQTIAHVSDLHVGERRSGEALSAIVAALEGAAVDLVLVTGDVTHRGRLGELERFTRAFAPLRERLLVVPGNHDRMGDDAGRWLMPGGRVAVSSRPGMYVVRFDSTAPHNRGLLACHGRLSVADVHAVDSAVGAAPPGALVVLMLHHHLLPLPGDLLVERLASLVGLPNASELERGRELVDRLRGRCELIVHGHRHSAGEVLLPPRSASRPLRILNAGSTPELGRVRLLSASGGHVVAERWLELGVTGGRVAIPMPDLPPRAFAGVAREAA